MTQAEIKARELVIKFKNDNLNLSFLEAKQCALICVDEIIKNNPHQIIEKFYVDSGGNKTDDKYFEMVSNQFFWQEVKQHLNNL